MFLRVDGALECRRKDGVICKTATSVITEYYNTLYFIYIIVLYNIKYGENVKSCEEKLQALAVDALEVTDESSD